MTQTNLLRDAIREATGLDFVVPADWIETERVVEDGTVTARYGPPASGSTGFGSEPLLTILSGGRSDSLSFRDLRVMVTGGEFDPLGTDAPTDSTLTVTGYNEITEPSVWGLRIAVLTDQNQVIDMTGLVDRRSQTLSLASVTCTQACYTENLDEISDIVNSWTIGDD